MFLDEVNVFEQKFRLFSKLKQIYFANHLLASILYNFPVENNLQLFIPNAFTPNDDGFNDIFYINANDLMIKQVNKFQIFTRWGELVFTDEDFQPNTPDHGWDGFFKGEKMNPAVFVYFAEIEFRDGFKIIYRGDVALRK